MDFLSLLGAEIDKKRQLGAKKRKKEPQKELQKEQKRTTETPVETNASAVEKNSPRVELNASTQNEAESSEYHAKEERLETQEEVNKMKEGNIAKAISIEEKTSSEDNKIFSDRKILESQEEESNKAKWESYKKQWDLENTTDKQTTIEDIVKPERREKLHTQIRIFIKETLAEWELDLDQIDQNRFQKNDDNIELQRALLADTKRAMVRLLYKLRVHTLAEHMLVSLGTIIRCLQSQDYKSANESYMKFSIGNATWPIGVKSIGIHERSTSLKIAGNTNDKASSFMLDDKTRRWITATKRLISFLERKHT